MGDLTKNFSLSEFICRCGCCYDDIELQLVKNLQVLRDRLMVPIYINSGCRCAKHNEAVRGNPNSQHLWGRAADISTTLDPVVVARAAADSGLFKGIMVYGWGVHLDIRPGKKYWAGI